MVTAEQHAVVDVGASALLPGVDVVGFGPGDGAIALREPASAVAGGEGVALPGGEEPLQSADVERAGAGFVKEDRQDAGVADVPVGGVDGDPVGLAVEEGGTGAVVEVALGDENTHGVTLRAEHPVGFDLAADAEQVDEGVEGDLPGRALVGHESFGALALLGVDEAGPAAAG